MNDSELISLIIPVHNVEKYLYECIESVICQTYTNLEIILIDDGSKDKSGEICEEYGKKDNRIIVIHQENGGVSSARNIGLEVAKGKYISFVDSDDYIEKTFIEELYKKIKENDAQISMCGLNKIDDNNEILGTYGYSKDFIDGRELLENKYIQDGYLWNKLYSAEIWKNQRFLVRKNF